MQRQIDTSAENNEHLSNIEQKYICSNNPRIVAEEIKRQLNNGKKVTWLCTEIDLTEIQSRLFQEGVILLRSEKLKRIINIPDFNLFDVYLLAVREKNVEGKSLFKDEVNKRSGEVTTRVHFSGTIVKNLRKAATDKINNIDEREYDDAPFPMDFIQKVAFYLQDTDLSNLQIITTVESEKDIQDTQLAEKFVRMTYMVLNRIVFDRTNEYSSKDAIHYYKTAIEEYAKYFSRKSEELGSLQQIALSKVKENETILISSVGQLQDIFEYSTNLNAGDNEVLKSPFFSFISNLLIEINLMNGDAKTVLGQVSTEDWNIALIMYHLYYTLGNLHLNLTVKERLSIMNKIVKRLQEEELIATVIKVFDNKKTEPLHKAITRNLGNTYDITSAGNIKQLIGQEG